MKVGTLWAGIGMMCIFGLGLLLIQVRLIYANPIAVVGGFSADRQVLPSWLVIQGKLELAASRVQNGDLTPPQSDARTLVKPELQLEAQLTPSDHVEGRLVLELAHGFELEDDLNKKKPERLVFGVREANIKFRELFGTPLSLQIGRQEFEDSRQWLYDNELDGIRLSYMTARLHVEAFFARVATVDKGLINVRGQDKTDYYQLLVEYRFIPRLTFSTYMLAQNDNLPMGKRPLFVGLRATGEPVDNIYYWIDAAHVRGKDGDRRLRGWGIDIGSLYQVELPLAPFLITSFAVGSGDKTPESSTDTSFRQTGLQGNGAKFRSATEIQYYGELLNPELSNLLIFTTGMGMRPLPNATLIVLYHIYRQYAPSEALREAAIDVELTGESRDLGREVDVMGVWAIDNVEFKLVFGAFFPGSAFPAKAEMAFFSQLRMKVTF